MDIVTMIPAFVTGKYGLLTLEGLNKAQKTLRLGSALVRGAEAISPGPTASRAAGAGMALARDSKPPAETSPQVEATAPSAPTSTPAPTEIPEGSTAIHPKTGHRIVLKGGQWLPAQ